MSGFKDIEPRWVKDRGKRNDVARRPNDFSAN